MTEQEYLAFDQEQPLRHEFYNGEVVAMAGASEAHALVTMNLGRAIGNRLAGSGCRVYSADLRVQVAETGADVYPDLTVVCGPSTLLPTTPVTLRNPRVARSLAEQRLPLGEVWMGLEEIAEGPA